MNYNLISYIIYIPITTLITVVVGKLCHANGLVYIQSLFKNEKIAHSINNLLLVGYYLVNIGYAILMVERWPNVTSVGQVFNELSGRIGLIVMLLAFLHYFNVAILSIAHREKKIIKTNT
ncbi:MAG: hypothetical protein QNK23_07125 [Crocinitomicaceae bacterium]|nr:hypothetical protein [Crocinitomicaceae bacterium]